MDRDEPLTKPHIPGDVWKVLPDDFTRVAHDAHGVVWAGSSDLAVLHKEGTQFSHWDAEQIAEITGLKGVNPGTCDWRDSLVQRPEGK